MRGRSCVAAAAVVVGLLVGCSGGGEPSARVVDEPTQGTAGGRGEVLDGTEILAAVGPSVALVETPIGTGSAVLLEDGRLVTSAHVVDPFPAVGVRFGAGDPQEVEVTSVDLVRDIAVLGPIEQEGVAMAASDDVEIGEDVYLVGYPGDSAEPEVTITRGLLSRRRSVPDWPVDLLQTDAAIAGGQSGGALVSETGEVVGISGFSYDEAFGLAVDGADVLASVDAPVSDEAFTWLPPVDEATETDVAVALDGGVGLDRLYLPGGAPDGELVLEADPGTAIEVTDLALYPVAVNAEAVELGAAEPSGDPASDADLPEPTDAASPGRWVLTVPSAEPLLVRIDSTDGDATAVDVTSSQPFAVVSPYDDVREVAPGDEVDGVVTAFGEADTFDLELAAGQTVEIRVTSALGDMAFTTYRLDDPDDPDEEADDGGGGVFDLDAASTLTADVAGTWAIDVYQVDGYSTAYRLVVEAA